MYEDEILKYFYHNSDGVTVSELAYRMYGTANRTRDIQPAVARLHNRDFLRRTAETRKNEHNVPVKVSCYSITSVGMAHYDEMLRSKQRKVKIVDMTGKLLTRSAANRR